MANTARLFAAHSGGPPSTGPWWLAEENSDPNLLTDAMQTCFLKQLIPIHALASLADNLKAKRLQGGQWLEIIDLEKIYSHCGIPAHQWNRLTNLLEKLAILTAARP